MDAGLRPVAVARARVQRVDAQNSMLRIPKAESSKGTENWAVALKEQTARMLSRWLDQHATFPKYDDTDVLWLTREGNPYSSQSLNDVLGRLCEIAEIDTDHRSLTWYSVGHSVGTYVTREEDLAAAAFLEDREPDFKRRLVSTSSPQVALRAGPSGPRSARIACGYARSERR